MFLHVIRPERCSRPGVLALQRRVEHYCSTRLKAYCMFIERKPTRASQPVKSEYFKIGAEGGI